MGNRLIVAEMLAATILVVWGSVTVAQTPKVREESGADPPSVTQARIMVGRNVMVSAKHRGWEHVEYVADADPLDRRRVMVCSMRFSQTRNQLTTGIYVTFDGGKTWMLGHNDSSSRFGGVFDPACAYGADGNAFFLTLALSESAPAPMEGGAYGIGYKLWGRENNRDLRLFSSADGGNIWNLRTELNFIDRPELKIDRTNGPYRNRMYLYGNTPDASMWLVYSTDGGRTWVRSAETGIAGVKFDQDGPGTILPDGTLLLPYCIAQNTGRDFSQTPAVAASADGGAHITKPVTVTASQVCQDGSTGLASDHSFGPFRGRAYYVWGERGSVFISHSNDKGKTWSPAFRVSDGPTRPAAVGTQRLMSRVVVNKDGIVGVTWYDSIKGTTGLQFRLRFSASLDGGETWLPSVPVSTDSFLIKHQPPEFYANTYTSGGGGRREKPTDLVNVRVGPSPRGYYPWNKWPGDYTGIAASADGVFHAFWIDNRTRVGELYTARVIVQGTVERSGGRELAGLENITSSLEVQYTSSIWNPKTKTVALEHQLLNTSRDAIAGPLKIRIVQLESDLGKPTLVLPNGQKSAAGTVLDLSLLIPPLGLAPGRTSDPQRLYVKFDKIDELSSIQRDVVRMKMMIYGVRRQTASGLP